MKRPAAKTKRPAASMCKANVANEMKKQKTTTDIMKKATRAKLKSTSKTPVTMTNAPCPKVTKKHAPIHILKSTVYCDMPRKLWRVKPESGSRVTHKILWGRKPHEQWPLVLAKIRECNK